MAPFSKRPYSFKKYYSEGLAALGSEFHFTAHSHHLWPDVTLQAQLEYWKMSATRTDRKWEHFFGSILPTIQQNILKMVDAPQGTTLAIGANTHELFLRLLSNFTTPGRPLKILSTDSEFHSFERQTRRLEEDGDLEVLRVATEPFVDFEIRLAEAAASFEPDLIFFSRVFFNSGYIVSVLPKLLASLPAGTPVVIDDYHGFFAVPISLGDLGLPVFYLSGGYKYAQWGEGACFLLLPPGHRGRPKNTGWYAGMSHLQTGRVAQKVPYDEGMEYYGATADLTPWMRAQSIFHWYETLKVPLPEFHAHIGKLQHELHQILCEHTPWAESSLIPMAAESRGHFLTYRICEGLDKAVSIETDLTAKGIRIDRRGNRLRFGLGWYHDEDDLLRLKTRGL